MPVKKRTNAFLVRLDNDEMAALNQKVKLSGLSREAFVRNTLAGKRVIELPPVDYGKLIFETRRVGQNLNRLLRFAYANNYFNTPEIKECLEKIRGVEDQIHAAFFRQTEEGDGKKQ